MTEFTRKSSMLSSLDGDAPYAINGVAIGEGDVTRGSSGVEKQWPGEELEKAASSLMGRPLVVNHNNNVEGVVGKVTKADYKEGVGVLYEAQLYDEDIAEQVSNELLEVSIRGYHIDVDEMEESDDGAKIVEGIKFDNLSIVPVGAAPSNSLQMGEAADLSEAQLEEYVGELQEEIEPGQFVQLDDKKGVVLLVEDGEAEVDIYTEVDDGWASSGETEMVSTGQLSSWDVDEEDITSMPDSDEDEEEASEDGDDPENDADDSDDADDPENGDTVDELFVRWDEGQGRVVEQNDDLITVELFEQADDGVWEPTGKSVEVEESNVSEWSVTAENAEGTERHLVRREKSEEEPQRYPDGDPDEEELAEATVHDVSYDGTDNSRDWSKPSLSDFADDSWEDLSSDEKKDIGGHFFASTSGFPASSFGDMKLPAVWPNGDLSRDGLDSVVSMATQTNGLSSDQQETVQSKAENLLGSKFEDGDSEENEEEDGTSDHPSFRVMSGDDLSASNMTGDSEQLTIITMNIEEKLEELDNPVALEASELEELRQKSDEVEELKEEQQTVSEMSESIAELRERQEILDEVDRDLVEELRDSDDAIVVESTRFEELESEADTVKTLYAERVSEEMAAFDADELKEKYTLDELREKYEAVGGDIEEELTPAPKSTDPSDEEVEEAQEGEDPSGEDEEISQKQEELRGKLFGGD